MSWGLAHRASETAFLAKGQDTLSYTRQCAPQFLQLRSRLENRDITRFSLALCRAGGSRGVPASAPTISPMLISSKP
eukprot:872511-Rhodomonas_salina.1